MPEFMNDFIGPIIFIGMFLVWGFFDDYKRKKKELYQLRKYKIEKEHPGVLARGEGGYYVDSIEDGQRVLASSNAARKQ